MARIIPLSNTGVNFKHEHVQHGVPAAYDGLTPKDPREALALVQAGILTAKEVGLPVANALVKGGFHYLGPDATEEAQAMRKAAAARMLTEQQTRDPAAGLEYTPAMDPTAGLGVGVGGQMRQIPSDDWMRHGRTPLPPAIFDRRAQAAQDRQVENLHTFGDRLSETDDPAEVDGIREQFKGDQENADTERILARRGAAQAMRSHTLMPEYRQGVALHSAGHQDRQDVRDMEPPVARAIHEKWQAEDAAAKAAGVAMPQATLQSQRPAGDTTEQDRAAALEATRTKLKAKAAHGDQHAKRLLRQWEQKHPAPQVAPAVDSPQPAPPPAVQEPPAPAHVAATPRETLESLVNGLKDSPDPRHAEAVRVAQAELARRNTQETQQPRVEEIGDGPYSHEELKRMMTQAAMLNDYKAANRVLELQSQSHGIGVHPESLEDLITGAHHGRALDELRALAPKPKAESAGIQIINEAKGRETLGKAENQEAKAASAPARVEQGQQKADAATAGAAARGVTALKAEDKTTAPALKRSTLDEQIKHHRAMEQAALIRAKRAGSHGGGRQSDPDLDKKARLEALKVAQEEGNKADQLELSALHQAEQEGRKHAMPSGAAPDEVLNPQGANQHRKQADEARAAAVTLKSLPAKKAELQARIAKRAATYKAAVDGLTGGKPAKPPTAEEAMP